MTWKVQWLQGWDREEFCQLVAQVLREGEEVAERPVYLLREEQKIV